MKERRSLPEIATLTVSAALVVFLAGFLGWHGLFVKRRPPALKASVLVEKARQSATLEWTLPVEIRNEGDFPLQALRVAVELIDADGARRTVNVDLPYLAERASETVFVLSQTDPRQARPRATVESFQAQGAATGY